MDSSSSSKQINRKKFNRSQTKKLHHKDQKNLKKCQNSNRSEEEKRNKSCGDDEFTNKLLSQLNCRFAELSDEDDTESGKAFEDLVNAPVSTSSFVFKSEKKWTWDSSQFSDYFSVDVNHLSRIFNCIPFTEYVGVEEKYLSKDELTLINSSSDQSRKDYLKDLEESLKLKALEDQNYGVEGPKEIINNVETTEEDLDFLLSLKEPVRVLSTASPALSRVTEDSRGKTDDVIKSTKSIDLEKWLDSVLDD